jgi:hypothetical protein
MLWTAALLSLIVWAIGWESGFLGVSVHVFLLLGLLAVLAALLPPRRQEDLDEESPAGGRGRAGDEC